MIDKNSAVGRHPATGISMHIFRTDRPLRRHCDSVCGVREAGCLSRADSFLSGPVVGETSCNGKQPPRITSNMGWHCRKLVFFAASRMRADMTTSFGSHRYAHVQRD
jgi:hypothetical protein